MHVYDKALVWHQQFIKRYGENSPWEVYEQEALKRFGSVFEDPMMELKNLKQTSIVQHYQDLYEELVNKVDLNEKHAISLFIGGLKDEVGMPIRMFNLPTLMDAYCQAKKLECANVALKPRYTSQSFNRPANFGYGNRTNGILQKPIVNNNVTPTAPDKRKNVTF